MTETSNNHLHFKGQLTLWGKQIRDHESKVVHDEVERACSTESLVFINVGDDGLEGCVSSEDEKEEDSEFNSFSSGIA